MKPSNILFVHYGENWIRGSEVCLLSLINNLDREKYNPILWTNNIALLDALKESDIRVYHDRFTLIGGWVKPRFNVFNFLYLVLRSIALVLVNRVELIHSNSGGPCQWLFIANKICGKTLVSHIHAPYTLKDRITLGLHFSDVIVGVSNFVCKEFLQDNIKQHDITTIYNGVHVPSNLRNFRKGTEHRTKLLFIGSLIQRKGVDLILQALSIAVRNKEDITLTIAGSGPEEEHLKLLAQMLDVSEHVNFLGNVKNAPESLLPTHDVLIGAPLEEAFGLVYAEAGAYEVPCICTETPGVNEVLIHGQTGLLTHNRSPMLLAEYIHLLHFDRELRKILGVQARTHISNTFSEKSYVNKFENLYAQCISGEIHKESAIKLFSKYTRRFFKKLFSRNANVNLNTQAHG